MVICVPVTPEGTVDGSFGRAARVAVFHVDDGTILGAEEHAVGWDVLHDEGPHGSHHGRIVRFLMDQGVEAVVADFAGPPMVNTMGKMGLRVWLGASGDARSAALAAAAAAAATNAAATG
jgi:predicted Fe-Mo cluster-binding NifX family protein